MDGHGGQVDGGHDSDGHSHGLGQNNDTSGVDASADASTDSLGLGHEKGHGGQVDEGHDPDTGHTHGLGQNKDTSGVDVGANQEDGDDTNDGTTELDGVVEAAAAELETTSSN